LNTHSLERQTPRDDAHPAPRQRPRLGQRRQDATGKLKSVIGAAKTRANSGGAAKSAFRRALATPGMLRRAYLRMLAPAHMLYRDRHVEKLLFKRTAENPIKTLRHADADTIYDGPMPGQVFDWIIRDLDITLRECAFVDFRAGSARTLLYAAMHEFERVIGYEYTEATHDDAQLNISQFPRTYMKCRDVEVRRGDRGDIVIPDQPLVLFFPNVGKERFLSLMLDHVSASYRVNPRRIYIIMENAGESSAEGCEDIFEEIKLPMATRLKLKLFSPVDIRVYRSLV
jgi:hypothetical protein